MLGAQYFLLSLTLRFSFDRFCFFKPSWKSCLLLIFCVQALSFLLFTLVSNFAGGYLVAIKAPIDALFVWTLLPLIIKLPSGDKLNIKSTTLVTALYLVVITLIIPVISAIVITFAQTM